MGWVWSGVTWEGSLFGIGTNGGWWGSTSVSDEQVYQGFYQGSYFSSVEVAFRRRGIPIRWIASIKLTYTITIASSLVANTDMGWVYTGWVLEGDLRTIDTNGDTWAVTSSSADNAYELWLSREGSLQPSNTASRRYGFPIRGMAGSQSSGWGSRDDERCCRTDSGYHRYPDYGH